MDSQVMEPSGNEDIKFLTVSQSFEERADFGNGVNLLPEELITTIFDYIQPYELLKLSEVCHKWNSIIKQPYLWRKKYVRKYKEKPRKYQWFVLFSMVTTEHYDVKPVHRGDADTRFRNWTADTQTNNTSRLISPVEGYEVTSITGHVPLHLRKITRCISKTKMYINEPNVINFGSNRLVNSIINAFRPVTYVMEWLSCCIVTHSSSDIYKMIYFLNNGRLSEYCTEHAIERTITEKLSANWKKTPTEISAYSLLNSISFLHVITINQPNTGEMLEDNVIDIMGRKPKIFACSLPEENCEISL